MALPQEPANSSIPTASPISSPAPTPKAEKSWSHDFPEINKDAVEAIEHFTKDGVPESAYVNIDSGSEENILTSKTLNLSLEEQEDIKVAFVSGNRVDYEWTFNNWLSEDDYEIDLTAELREETENEFPGVYTLSFKDGKTVSENVLIFRLNMGVSDNAVYVYDRIGDEYEEIYKGYTDEDGFLELNPVELTDYVVSLTDILGERERIAAEEKAEAERKEAERLAAERKAELEKAGARDLNTASPAVTEQPEPAPDEPAKEDKSTPVLLAILGIAVVVLIGSVIVMAKGRK